MIDFAMAVICELHAFDLCPRRSQALQIRSRKRVVKSKGLLCRVRQLFRQDECGTVGLRTDSRAVVNGSLSRNPSPRTTSSQPASCCRLSCRHGLSSQYQCILVLGPFPRVFRRTPPAKGVIVGLLSLGSFDCCKGHCLARRILPTSLLYLSVLESHHLSHLDCAHKSRPRTCRRGCSSGGIGVQTDD